jgi:hypothetical protein
MIKKHLNCAHNANHFDAIWNINKQNIDLSSSYQATYFASSESTCLACYMLTFKTTAFAIAFQEREHQVATSTKKPLDKEQLLNQKLEDFAGDEFDENEYDYTNQKVNFKAHDIAEELDSMDFYH